MNRDSAAQKPSLNLFFLMIAGSLLLGCGGRSDIGEVTGTVTLDGQPLANATIVFQPQGAGSASFGKTDANGVYEMQYGENLEGAYLGTNQVTISTFFVGDPDADSPQPNQQEQVPARYNTETELTAEVKTGSNTIDFALEPGELPDWQKYSSGGVDDGNQ